MRTAKSELQRLKPLGIYAAYVVAKATTHKDSRVPAHTLKLQAPERATSLLLNFSSHAAYYVVYCDVAYGMLRAIYYCQAAQIVLVEEFEDVFVVGVGCYR